MRNARIVMLWYFVARRKQQENSQQQVRSAKASPLAFSPIAGQPCRFSDSRKMAENAKCAFSVVMELGCARQAAGEILTDESGLPGLALLLSA